MTVRVGIIGSGPAGLTTALALEKATTFDEVELTLLDRNHDAVDYPGVEYTIQARACHALDRLGLKDAALTVGNPGTHIALHVLGTDKAKWRIRLDPKNNSEVDRPEFLENLSKLLRRTQILREHYVTDLEPREHGRVLLRFGPDEHGTPQPQEFDIVIACDGINSVARKKYFPDQQTFDRGFSAIYFRAVGDPADPRTSETFTTFANGGTSQIVMGTFTTNAMFPQGRHRLALALAFDHRTGDRLWADHELAPGTPWRLVPAATKEAITRTLARDTPVRDGLMEAAVDLVDDWEGPSVYHWRMRDSDPLQHPYAPDCNLVLVGDSCHGFLPTIGEGASLSIEDGERLGTRLGQYLSRAADLPIHPAHLVAEVFEPWAAERRPVYNDLMRRARLAARNWIGQGERRGWAVSAYVPTRFGSIAVGAVEGRIDRWHRRHAPQPDSTCTQHRE